MERREGTGPPKSVEGLFTDCPPQAWWSAQCYEEGGIENLVQDRATV